MQASFRYCISQGCKHEHTLCVINMNNWRFLYSRWFTASVPLQTKSAWWITDASIWLSFCTIQFGLHILKHGLHFSAGWLSGCFCPSLSHFPRGESMGVFLAFPLFTCFFVLGCHIISLSDDVASLRAHNEEVVAAHSLVSLHCEYHRMLGHAIVQMWTYLSADRCGFYSGLYDNCRDSFRKKYLQ